MKRLKCRIECKWQDAWIGAFWRRSKGVLHIWICAIPCLPFHLEIGRTADKKSAIICLCGSVRFLQVFQEVAYREALAGHIVLTVECEVEDGMARDLSSDLRLHFDELHRRKIELADEVLALNVDGYVGAHTRREIEYARSLGKPVRWLEPESENGHA